MRERTNIWAQSNGRHGVFHELRLGKWERSRFEAGNLEFGFEHMY